MKLIVVTPAGRDKYLRLLSHYVLGNPRSPSGSCGTIAASSPTAHTCELAASDPRCRLKQLPDANGDNRAIGSFFQFCDDPDAFYLRLDDDIVFIEEGFFSKFTARATAARGRAIWFAPMIINNAICNFLLQQFSALRIGADHLPSHVSPFVGLPEPAGSPTPGLHRGRARSGRLGDFRVPDRDVRLIRFSVNAIGFFGAEKIALGDTFLPPGCTEEEEWLSAVLPAKTDRPGRIFGDLIVAHFSFYTQEPRLLRTDILDAYYSLAGLPAPQYERPPEKVRLKDRLRPWRVGATPTLRNIRYRSRRRDLAEVRPRRRRWRAP